MKQMVVPTNVSQPLCWVYSICFSSPPVSSLLSAPRLTCLDCTDGLRKLLASYVLSQWEPPQEIGGKGENERLVLDLVSVRMSWTGFSLDVRKLLSEPISMTLLLGSGTLLLPLSLWARCGGSCDAGSSRFLHYPLWFPFIHVRLCN